MLFAPRKGQGHQFVRIMLELKTWIHISSYAYKMFIIWQSTSLRNFAVLSSLAEARGIKDLSLDQLIDYMQLPTFSRLLPQE